MSNATHKSHVALVEATDVFELLMSVTTDDGQVKVMNLSFTQADAQRLAKFWYAHAVPGERWRLPATAKTCSLIAKSRPDDAKASQVVRLSADDAYAGAKLMQDRLRRQPVRLGKDRK